MLSCLSKLNISWFWMRILPFYSKICNWRHWLDRKELSDAFAELNFSLVIVVTKKRVIWLILSKFTPLSEVKPFRGHQSIIYWLCTLQFWSWVERWWWVSKWVNIAIMIQLIVILSILSDHPLAIAILLGTCDHLTLRHKLLDKLVFIFLLFRNCVTKQVIWALRV